MAMSYKESPENHPVKNRKMEYIKKGHIVDR